MNTENLKYNQMFNAVVINIFSKTKNDSSKIDHVTINDFDSEIISHQVFMYAANTATTIWGGKIYLHMPLSSYIKWKWPRRHTHKNFRWKFRYDTSRYGLVPFKELEYVSDANGYPMAVWHDIYQKFFTNYCCNEEDDKCL